MGNRSLEQFLQEHQNDYSALENIYHSATGGELVVDPFRSIYHGPEKITLSVSIIIPAWNAGNTISQCLISIEQSSFNHRYPDLLEVIVVDDGSTDNTWEILKNIHLKLRLTVVRQMHLSAGQARNTGVSIACGDVLIFCDADMILTKFAIEELVKRHQVLDKVLLIGFRQHIHPKTPSIQIAKLRESLLTFLPEFYTDERVLYPWSPGWPESICRDTDHLKLLGQGRTLYMSDETIYDLPGLVYGALFSIQSSDYQILQGFDERFYGWGCEDDLIGARAIGIGNFIIPVFSATGLHIIHPMRSTSQWSKNNEELYHKILKSPFPQEDMQVLQSAKRRIVEHFQHNSIVNINEINRKAYEIYDQELNHSLRLGTYFYHLGRYKEALKTFSAADGNEYERAQGLYYCGKLMRITGQNQDAVATLSEASRHLSNEALPLIELALAYASMGDFGSVHQSLEKARLIEPENKLLRYILDGAASKHLKRGLHHMRQSFYHLAIQDFEIALARDPYNLTVQKDHKICLQALEKAPVKSSRSINNKES